ncbi:hypothetical protein VP01_2500g3 [Puccinia sorghi]|uniref:Myb/SANT-like domain-containing protein n=1 Tax=Puccinia sorghi TaxID=27349 RepID=A0A0L6V6A8_9BASI|nr:hypothetical protein VP01_2500g3 [Puccinia sorghi]
MREFWDIEGGDFYHQKAEHSQSLYGLQCAKSSNKGVFSFHNIQVVEEGKRSDGSFKGKVHQWVAGKLSKKIEPGSFNTFKKWQDALVACCEASGFGWDEARCEVTASDETAPCVYQSHPHARRFQNQPFPGWFHLSIIFGTTATGENSCSIGQSTSQNTPGRRRRDSCKDADEDNTSSLNRGNV